MRAHRIPRRVSLVEQAADILRQRLGAGEWRARLPAERALARELQIARNTLREAIAMLADEGWVAAGGRGRARRVAGRSVRPRRRGPAADVVFLTPERREALQPVTLLQADILRERLQAEGFPLHVETSPAFETEHPQAALARLAAVRPSAVWILHRSTLAMQQWFAAAGWRTVVLGYAHPGIPLPSVSEDMAAVAVHAAGRLLSLGHTRIALIRPARERAGHRVVQEEMEAVLRRRAGPPAALDVVPHDGAAAGVCHSLDRLFDRPDPPTALLTVSSMALITAMTHLGSRRIAVPAQVSVLHLFDDPILDHVRPTIAHYRANQEAMMRKLAEKIVRLSRDPRADVRSARIMCDFIPGASLAPAGRGESR